MNKCKKCNNLYINDTCNPDKGLCLCCEYKLYNNFENLFKVLLSEIFKSDEIDWSFIEQIILRHAYNLGYVECNENNFILNELGKEFINELRK